MSKADNFGEAFSFTMLTNDPVVAQRGDSAGIDHIGLDFETLGKRERQPEPGAWISDHETRELIPVARVLKRARLFARTNPMNPESRGEVEHLLELGVNSIMLPMFTDAAEVARFIEFVDGRAYVSLLLETAPAVVRIDEVVRIPGIDEINIGLNDLHRAFKLKSHFEILTSDLLSMLSDKVRSHDIRFGFGTLGKVGDTGLPVPPDLVYAQYPRLGATSARLFRFFLGSQPRQLDFEREVTLLRQRLTYWQAQGPQAWEEARKQLQQLFKNW